LGRTPKPKLLIKGEIKVKKDRNRSVLIINVLRERIRQEGGAARKKTLNWIQRRRMQGAISRSEEAREKKIRAS